VTALQVATLGAIAGFTIFLGLPVGRLRNPSLAMKAFLNATATGVLLFLFWDVLAHAVEPVETALTAVTRDGTGSWMRFGALAAVAIASLTLGLMSLVYYEQWMADAKDAGGGGGARAWRRRHRRVSRAPCIRFRNGRPTVSAVDRRGHWIA